MALFSAIVVWGGGSGWAHAIAIATSLGKGEEKRTKEHLRRGNQEAEHLHSSEEVKSFISQNIVVGVRFSKGQDNCQRDHRVSQPHEVWTIWMS